MTKLNLAFNSKKKEIDIKLDGKAIEGIQYLSYSTYQDFDNNTVQNITVTSVSEADGVRNFETKMWTFKIDEEGKAVGAVVYSEKTKEIPTSSDTATNLIQAAMRK